MKNIFLLWVLLILSNYYAVSQTVEHPHGIAARVIFQNYHWPLKTVDDLRIVDFNSGLEFEYYRFLNEQFNLSFPLRISNGLLVIDGDGSTYKAGSIGLDALLNFKLIKEGWFRPHIFAGAGIFAEDIKEFSAVVPLGIGLNFQLGRNSFLSTTASYRVGLKDFRNNLQIGAGLRFNIAPPINKDEEKNTPDEIDKDGDGIIDSEDLCPDIKGSINFNGCPDTDDDGIPDGDDNCPSIAGLKTFGGCPDSDNDGLIDKEDDCPNYAGPVSNSGCPYDKVTNIASSTNVTKEKEVQTRIDTPIFKNQPTATYTQQQEETIVYSTPIKEETLDISNNLPTVSKADRNILSEAVQAIEFETASAIIKKESYSVLDGVSEVMKRNTSYQLRVSGHTDSIGSRKDNQVLSERRALACYNYLITKGVTPSRMAHEGFGESLPIEDNHFAPGREQNRRVEFTLFRD